MSPGDALTPHAHEAGDLRSFTFGTPPVQGARGGISRPKRSGSRVLVLGDGADSAREVDVDLDDLDVREYWSLDEEERGTIMTRMLKELMRAFLEQLTEMAGEVDACGFAETEAIVQRLLAPSNELAAFGLQAAPSSPRCRSLFRGVAANDGDRAAAVGASATASAAGLRMPVAARAPQASI